MLRTILLSAWCATASAACGVALHTFDGGPADAPTNADGTDGVDGPGPDVLRPDVAGDAPTDVPVSDHVDVADDLTALTVAITSPGATSYANATVTIQGVVTGNPDTVSVFIDGGMLASITAPYQYMWDTTTVSEASHAVQLQATRGGTTVMSNTVMVTVDRTPPTVTVRVPAAGATGVVFRSPIQVTFSEPVKPTTLTTTSVTYTATGVSAPIGQILTPSGDMISFTSLLNGSAPTFPTMITAALAGTIQDLAGNALAPTMWTWSAPIWAPLGAEVSNEGTGVMRLDPTGNPVLAWVSTGASPVMLNVQRWNGTRWTALGTPLSGTGSATTRVTDAAMVIDSTGIPSVAWVETTSAAPMGAIYAATWSGTAWTPLGGNLSYMAGDAVGTPAIAVDASNHQYVAWAENLAVERALLVRTWNGTAWVTFAGASPIFTVDLPETSPLDENIADQAELAVAPSGTVYVAAIYHSTISSDHAPRVFVQSATSGATSWTTVGGAAVSTGLAVDAAEHTSFLLHAGMPMVAWASGPNTSSIYAFQYSGVWGELGPAVAIGTGAAAGAHAPMLRVGQTGTPLLAWVESGHLNVDAFSGTVWTQRIVPYASDLSGSYDTERLSGDLDGYDAPVVVWSRFDSGSAGTPTLIPLHANQ